jgi:hypothetical protein
MITADFIKFGIAAFMSALLGSHAVYSYYQPMSVSLFVFSSSFTKFMHGSKYLIMQKLKKYIFKLLFITIRKTICFFLRILMSISKEKKKNERE